MLYWAYMNRPSFITWRPVTTYIFIGGLVTILIGLVVSYVLTNFIPTTPVRLASGVYNLQIADTDTELAQGLSGVKELGGGSGLLMKFPYDDTWGIWMKNMNIHIDIIWLNSDKQVVYIVKNASPESSTNIIYTPKNKARYVIELAAGGVDKAGIKIGNTADFDENDNGALW